MYSGVMSEVFGGATHVYTMRGASVPNAAARAAPAAAARDLAGASTEMRETDRASIVLM